MKQDFQNLITEESINRDKMFDKFDRENDRIKEESDKLDEKYKRKIQKYKENGECKKLFKN